MFQPFDYHLALSRRKISSNRHIARMLHRQLHGQPHHVLVINDVEIITHIKRSAFHYREQVSILLEYRVDILNPGNRLCVCMIFINMSDN